MNISPVFAIVIIRIAVLILTCTTIVIVSVPTSPFQMLFISRNAVRVLLSHAV